MIRIPEQISIAGVTYNIKWIDELEGGLVAQINFRKGIICIIKNMSDEVCFQSFMHEVLHGIMASQNINIGEQIYHDDDFVERISQLMNQVFKQVLKLNQNKDVIIMDEDKKDVLNIPVEFE